MSFAIQNRDLDRLVADLALAPAHERQGKAQALRHAAQQVGVMPASIAAVYRKLASGEVAPMTVPAMNLRGLTYDAARAVWRSVQRLEAGPVLFELAPIEAEVTDQTFSEYVAYVLAAAAREGYRGPVFFQGDHFQVPGSDPKLLGELKTLCRTAVSAGLFAIDLDAAGLAKGSAATPIERQHPNAVATAEMIAFLRKLEPDHLVIGGEVGEIGGANTSVEDLRAYLEALRERLPNSIRGLDKISVQTGTRHGGVVRSDGTTGTMPIDLDLARELSRVAREEFSLPGVVQHGASTLTLAQLGELPGAGVMEVHLATGIQNLVFDHPALPRVLLEQMKSELDEGASHAESGRYETPADLTLAQRFYQNRWKAWGRYKRELWTLDPEVRRAIRETLEAWSADLLETLWVAGRREVLEQYSKGTV